MNKIKKGETGKQYAHRLINISAKESKEKSRKEFLADLGEKAKHSYLWQRVLINIKNHYANE